ncbi:hypothetical protein D3C85_1715200 [compost metagenome]
MVPALVVRFGEAGLATFDPPAVEAVVAQADTTEGLRQHAAHATGNHRVVEEQVTGFEFGLQGVHFQGGAAGRE